MWSATYPYNKPALSIHCWNRNNTANLTSGNPLYLPKNADVVKSIGPIADFEILFVINMTEYKSYSPCQFFLEDSIDAPLTRGMVGSGGVEILINNKASAKNWTVSNEALLSSTWPTSDAESSNGDGRVLYLVVGWGLVLLAFGMTMMWKCGGIDARLSSHYDLMSGIFFNGISFAFVEKTYSTCMNMNDI